MNVWHRVLLGTACAISLPITTSIYAAEMQTDEASLSQFATTPETANTAKTELSEAPTTPATEPIAVKPVQPKRNYIYSVPFNGDYDEAYEAAFRVLINDISGGSTPPSSLKVDISNLIATDEVIDDELQVTFARQEVEKLIQSGAITVWEGLADPMIVWLVKAVSTGENDDTNDVQIVSSSSPLDAVSEAIVKQGQKNKVNVIFPMLDLEDMQRMTIPDVMRGESSKIIEASTKYTKGVALDAMLVKEGDAFRLIYHLVNIAEEQEVVSDALTGTPEQIASSLFVVIKKHLATQSQAPSSDKVLTPTVKKQPGFANIASLHLGQQPDGSFHILVQNLNEFSDLVVAKRILDSGGFSKVDVFDVKGSDAIYTLRVPKGNKYADLMAELKALQPKENYCYEFSTIVAEDALANVPANEQNATTEQQDGNQNAQEKTETAKSIQYNNQQKRGSSSAYPDPNRKLRTGGGLKE